MASMSLDVTLVYFFFFLLRGNFMNLTHGFYNIVKPGANLSQSETVDVLFLKLPLEPAHFLKVERSIEVPLLVNTCIRPIMEYNTHVFRWFPTRYRRERWSLLITTLLNH